MSEAAKFGLGYEGSIRFIKFMSDLGLQVGMGPAAPVNVVRGTVEGASNQSLPGDPGSAVSPKRALEILGEWIEAGESRMVRKVLKGLWGRRTGGKGHSGPVGYPSVLTRKIGAFSQGFECNLCGLGYREAKTHPV